MAQQPVKSQKEFSHTGMHVIILTDHSGSLYLYTFKLSDNTMYGTTQQGIIMVQANRHKVMFVLPV